MTPTSSTAAGETRFERIWEVADAQVTSGRLPGYAAAVRLTARPASSRDADATVFGLPC